MLLKYLFYYRDDCLLNADILHTKIFFVNKLFFILLLFYELFQFGFPKSP